MGHNDVKSKSAHAKSIVIYSISDDFEWVRHIPPLPSSSEALISPPPTFKGA